ncbi:hemerythrin domain-containing protein [Lentibacillus sp. Marseille-P4043]|uniref:hemerythrin domain-containing protein n=1 Tax=Lentibacillus sp. Marseille-P4043 TaxID=2040293 RepID=UPI001F4571E2|nr:hemerythrin domain-containing protein [Lentibacillus sp. Marseille-P4043]
MAKRNKGIKRHESLYPLSHHHHHALVLALKLKRIGTEKSELTENELKSELERFWEKDGNQHFRDEEEILLPVYVQYTSIEQPEITEMLLEHVTIRSHVHQILTYEDNLVSLMNNLGELLDTHIRKEERVLFPMIEAALPEHELQKLKPYLHIDD